MLSNVPKTPVIKYVSWFIVSFFVFFQFLIQSSSSLMQQAWTDYFHLTFLSVSYLSSALFYTYLLFQIPVGLIYDRCNAKYVLMIASFCLGLGCILFAFSHTIYSAIFARMIMGACAAFGFIGMLKVNSTLFPGRQFSLMVGLSDALAAFAMIGSMILIAWLLIHFTWQQVILQYAIILFITTLLVILFIRTKKPENISTFSRADLFNNIKSSFSNRVVIVTGIYGFFLFSVVNAFSSMWGIAFLTTAYPLDSVKAAKMMSAIFLGLGIGCPLYGYLSKRFGNEIFTMKISAIICAFTIFSVIYVKLPVDLLGPVFFILGVVCAVYIQCFAIIGQTVKHHIQATSMSVTNMLIMSSAPILQIFIGALLRNRFFGLAHTALANYHFALAILPVGMLIAYALCFVININKATEPESLIQPSF